MPGAWLGMYAAAKHAVEGMSESLRFEVGHAGIQVCILEPGMYVSDWQTGSLDVAAPQLEGRSAYQATVEAALAGFRARAKTRPRLRLRRRRHGRPPSNWSSPWPMRWPVGEDSTHLIESRMNATEAEWEALRLARTLRTWRRPGERGGVERDWGGENGRAHHRRLPRLRHGRRPRVRRPREPRRRHHAATPPETARPCARASPTASPRSRWT